MSRTVMVEDSCLSVTELKNSKRFRKIFFMRKIKNYIF